MHMLEPKPQRCSLNVQRGLAVSPLAVSLQRHYQTKLQNNEITKRCAVMVLATTSTAQKLPQKAKKNASSSPEAQYAIMYSITGSTLTSRSTSQSAFGCSCRFRHRCVGCSRHWYQLEWPQSPKRLGYRLRPLGQRQSLSYSRRQCRRAVATG